MNNNYGPATDSTASGGYGSSKNVWSDKVQRGRAEDEPDNSAGLIDQSTTGVPVGDEIEDAKQGKDMQSREEYAREAERDFGRESQPQAQAQQAKGLNPYGQNPDEAQ